MRGRWPPCPGTGHRPLEIRRTAYGIEGICPHCKRWIAVTPRSDKIVRHQAGGN